LVVGPVKAIQGDDLDKLFNIILVWILATRPKWFLFVLPSWIPLGTFVWGCRRSQCPVGRSRCCCERSSYSQSLPFPWICRPQLPYRQAGKAV